VIAYRATLQVPGNWPCLSRRCRPPSGAAAARAILAAAGFEPRVIIETDDHRVTFDVMNTVDAATILPGLALRAAPAHVRPAALNLHTDRRINLATRNVLRPHPAFTALENALRATASHG
jgi:hypothetical protein